MEIKSVQASQQFSDERFTKKILYQKGESLVFVLNFLEGQALPKHKHPDTHVYILVLQGGGTMTVDRVETTVSELDVVYCEGHEEFSFISTGSPATSLYVQLTKIPDARYAKEV